MTGKARRRTLITLAVAFLVAAGAIVATIALSGGEAQRLRGSRPPPGISLPAFELPDYAGRMVSIADLRGKAVLVTFLDTQCTESCPIIAGHVGSAFKLLSPEEQGQVVAVAISTDPDEDTRGSVEAFLRRHRAEGVLRYLVAPVAELRPVWNAFQIAASFDTGDDSLHSAPVRIYDRAGIWVSTLHAGADLTAENLAHDLRAVLSGGGERPDR